MSSHKCDSQCPSHTQSHLTCFSELATIPEQTIPGVSGLVAFLAPSQDPGTVLRLRHGSAESLISSGSPPHAWRKSQVIASKSQVVLIIMCVLSQVSPTSPQRPSVSHGRSKLSLVPLFPALTTLEVVGAGTSCQEVSMARRVLKVQLDDFRIYQRSLTVFVYAVHPHICG